MKSKTMFEKVLLFITGIFFLSAFAAYGVDSAVKSDAGMPVEKPLEKKYNKIVFKKFQVDPKTEADYQEAIAECENTAITAVKSKNIFDLVEKENAGTQYKDALIVKTKITSLRIVSGSARFWFGAAAGGSEMIVLVELIDASTGNIVREKELSTGSNPFASVMTGGGRDRTVSSDMGTMIAEYISLIQPCNAK